MDSCSFSQIDATFAEFTSIISRFTALMAATGVGGDTLMPTKPGAELLTVRDFLAAFA